MKGLITESISQWEEEDRDADSAKHSSKLETVVFDTLDGEIPMLQSKFGALSKRQLHVDTVCAGEQYVLAKANVDLDQGILGVVFNAVFDDCLTGDSKFKDACETCVKDNTVMVAIEVTVAEKSDLDGKGSICQDCEIPFHTNQQSGSESGSMHQQRAPGQAEKTREGREKRKGEKKERRKAMLGWTRKDGRKGKEKMERLRRLGRFSRFRRSRRMEWLRRLRRVKKSRSTLR